MNFGTSGTAHSVALLLLRQSLCKQNNYVSRWRRWTRFSVAGASHCVLMRIGGIYERVKLVLIRDGWLQVVMIGHTPSEVTQ